jgi:hypothetical protein
MNTLILNRDSFTIPEDNWYQLAPFGEFPHGGPSTSSGQAGIVQVIDEEACTAMAARFAADAGIEPFDELRAYGFAGLLVDFDHFSLDGERRTEAAGWIMGLEARVARDEGGNLKPEFGKPGDETAKNAKDANRDSHEKARGEGMRENIQHRTFNIQHRTGKGIATKKRKRHKKRVTAKYAKYAKFREGCGRRFGGRMFTNVASY